MQNKYIIMVGPFVKQQFATIYASVLISAKHRCNVRSIIYNIHKSRQGLYMNVWCTTVTSTELLHCVHPLGQLTSRCIRTTLQVLVIMLMNRCLNKLIAIMTIHLKYVIINSVSYIIYISLYAFSLWMFQNCILIRGKMYMELP